MQIYNTLTRQKEEFAPLEPGTVKMYVCGITPYDETHLGHGRAYVTFDVVRRYLEHCGLAVTHIQNITDVDDKIIIKAKDEGRGTKDVAEQYTASYFDVMDKLNVKRASVYPKATEHIPDMIKWISQLLMKGVAYELPDGIYFAVDAFADYGKLSGRKIEDMEAGARVEVHGGKRNPFDFALWKKAKEGEPAWDSPWGAGRPGWHIECSVMSTKYLGDQFDIHGGGMDLEFPHHENEIAQTEAVTGKVPWVKYWMHNGFVNINKQKMSKSLGNFFTLREIFDKFDTMVVRFFLLMTHYRSPINYSDAELKSAGEALGRIREFIADIDFRLGKTAAHAPAIEKKDMAEDLKPYKDKFISAMEDDFNTAGAIAAIFEVIKFCRKTLDEGEAERECLQIMKRSIVELCEILGIKFDRRPPTADNRTQEVETLIKEREEARKARDFKRSDEIRKQLQAQGIELEDTPLGTKWSMR